MKKSCKTFNLKNRGSDIFDKLASDLSTS